jgi:hypothetical protein
MSVAIAALPYMLSWLDVGDEIPAASGVETTAATAVEISDKYLKYHCTAFSSNMNTFLDFKLSPYCECRV